MQTGVDGVIFGSRKAQTGKVNRVTCPSDQHSICLAATKIRGRGGCQFFLMWQSILQHEPEHLVATLAGNLKLTGHAAPPLPLPKPKPKPAGERLELILIWFNSNRSVLIRPSWRFQDQEL